MKTRLVEVNYCSDCPWSVDASKPGEPWLCKATNDDNGLFRELPQQQETAGGPWLPPPSWCPLRKADHLVHLEIILPEHKA